MATITSWTDYDMEWTADGPEVITSHYFNALREAYYERFLTYPTGAADDVSLTPMRTWPQQRGLSALLTRLFWSIDVGPYFYSPGLPSDNEPYSAAKFSYSSWQNAIGLDEPLRGAGQFKLAAPWAAYTPVTELDVVFDDSKSPNWGTYYNTSNIHSVQVHDSGVVSNGGVAAWARRVWVYDSIVWTGASTATLYFAQPISQPYNLTTSSSLYMGSRNELESTPINWAPFWWAYNALNAMTLRVSDGASPYGVIPGTEYGDSFHGSGSEYAYTFEDVVANYEAASWESGSGSIAWGAQFDRYYDQRYMARYALTPGLKYQFDGLSHLDADDLATCPVYANALVDYYYPFDTDYAFENNDTTHAQGDAYRVLDGVTGTVSDGKLTAEIDSGIGNYDSVPFSTDTEYPGKGYKATCYYTGAVVDLTNAFKFKAPAE